MSRRGKILILVWGCLLTLIVYLVLRPEREPAYKGRSLSEWEVDYYNQDFDPKAADAIRMIGADAVPHLLRRIDYEPKPALESIDRVFTSLQYRLWGRSRFWSFGGREAVRAAVAPQTLSLLVRHADLAIPELTRILNNPTRRWAARNAATALAKLGQPGISPLLAALNSTNLGLRAITLDCVNSLGTNARPVVPVLIHILETDTEDNSKAAIFALGTLSIEPDIVVPALVKALSSPSLRIRESAAGALSSYGPLARAAIPTLTGWLNSTDLERRGRAIEILHEIDPQTFPDDSLPEDKESPP